MKTNKALYFMGKVANAFEFVIAVLLLVAIAIRAGEILLEAMGIQAAVLNVDFDRLLSIAFSLVIGVEFTKMLCKHTPETVIDVLLFAIARQTIIYHEGTMEMLMGVVAIVALFTAKRFLVEKYVLRKREQAQAGE